MIWEGKEKTSPRGGQGGFYFFCQLLLNRGYGNLRGLGHWILLWANFRSLSALPSPQTVERGDVSVCSDVL